MLNESAEIVFKTNSYFDNIYSPLPQKNKNKFFAENFSVLYDSPFQISNSKSYFFSSMGCRHEVVFEGEVKKYTKKILSDLKKITTTEIKMMGKSPNKKYLFIINMTDSAYGGLEHSSSSVNIFDPCNLFQKKDYQKLLGLLAHEYFHLWNVKRLRPLDLDTLDFQSPILTKELWFAEGVTSFYDNYILLQCGLLNKEDYLAEVFQDIQALENSDGENWMSLEESSLTAWTKYYKPQSNSHNTGISYYMKGAIFVLCMDLYIRDKTKSKKCFLDIFKSMYIEYYQNKNTGFTKEDFFYSAKIATGVDVKKEFGKFLSSRNRLPVYKYLSLAGIQKEEKQKKLDLPFSIREDENKKQIISKIYQQRIGSNTNLSIGDELISINERQVNNKNFAKLKDSLHPKKEAELLIARRGKILKSLCKPYFVYLDSKLIFQQSPTKRQMAVRETFFQIHE
ncbi:MAG: M61 family metallopeptidase [Leptospiraceae bacterium]|nr:M61 family metallopeptidase [Leptospiraceae bacterium]NUM41062.1 M61 family metallopeptidase [Leptospiraceae bacterium]